MSSDTGMTIVVVGIDKPHKTKVNVYRIDERNYISPALKDIDLPMNVFPHEPVIGESFQLVVA